ncbi:YveK family protein [Butyrivibrio sp. WCD3002]|uniref:YveK family protein n=1 Tax=Butyrivibrio sp. WCD3002 TaxID=1280676 RepID=UPI000424E95A|nr:Wzz/FepE/Etk N-terminal domain-containing protein [Butyrivibrio sp. WCD3002]
MDKKQTAKQFTDTILNDDQNQNGEMEIDLVDLFFYLQAKLRWIVLFFIAGAIISGLITVFLITPKYSASAKLYMVSASSDTLVNLTDLNLGTSLSADYQEVVKIRPIFEDVIKELDLPYTYEQLLGMTSISVVNNTRILTIKVTSTSPEEAAEIANALAKDAESQVPKLMDTSKPHIIEPAIVPIHRSSPSYSKNIIIGALVGLVVIVSILTAMFVMDDTFNSAEDVEKMFGVMPLTTIPESDIGILSEFLEHDRDNKKGLAKIIDRKSRKRHKKKK